MSDRDNRRPIHLPRPCATTAGEYQVPELSGECHVSAVSQLDREPGPIRRHPRPQSLRAGPLFPVTKRECSSAPELPTASAEDTPLHGADAESVGAGLRGE